MASARASAARWAWPPEILRRLASGRGRRRRRGRATAAPPPVAVGLGGAPRAGAEGHVLQHGEVGEQQVVLEHDADRPLLGGHEHPGGRVVDDPAVDRDTARGRCGWSPARARSTVVLPAPFGPSRATTSPASTARSTSRCEGPELDAQSARVTVMTAPASGRAATRSPRATRPAAPGSGRWPRRGRLRARGRPRGAGSGSCR